MTRNSTIWSILLVAMLGLTVVPGARVWLLHGSADGTISSVSFDQAIVEWTDILGTRGSVPRASARIRQFVPLKTVQKIFDAAFPSHAVTIQSGPL